jgi:lipopolysaccharide transport system permease protein
VAPQWQPFEIDLRERILELVKYRALLRALVIRDIKLRYRESVLGFIWTLGNPLLMMAIFTVVFTILMPNNVIPKYPIFILCALLPWNYFSTAIMGSIDSIVGNARLIKLVSFPQELLPLSIVLANLVNFLLALVVLFAMLFAFRVHLSPWALYLPLIIFIQTIFTLGLALIFATLNVFYRDTKIIMEVGMLAWFFLTPVFYRIEDLVPRYATLMYWVNPMASFISWYRIVLYHGISMELGFIFRTFVTSAAALIMGYLVFTRYSSVFAEEV